MNTQYSAYPTFELSPFCANDTVYASANFNLQSYDLPDSKDLIDTINHQGHRADWPLTLLLIGLSPFRAGHLEIDERTRHIGSLGVAAKLQQCVRIYNEKALVEKNAHADNRPDLTTRHTIVVTGDPAHRQAELYRLTNTQFAVLAVTTGKPLVRLQKNLLATLQQPIFVGQQALTTSPISGAASSPEFIGRAESFLRAARTALFTAGQR